MFRLAVLLWVVGATTLAGIFVVVVLMVPSLAGATIAQNIIWAAVAGSVMAVPLAFASAKAIAAKTIA